MANEVDCGPNTTGSFASYDPDSSSWKTYQLCLDGELGAYSETWPRAGMTRNGIAYQRRPLAPLTGGTGCLLWPTPQANKVTKSGELVNSDGTPWDGIRKPHSAITGHPVTTALADAVKKWPTPQARDWKSGSTQKDYGNSRPLSERVSGQLNPKWVEWLMGFPLGWTDLEDLETQ